MIKRAIFGVSHLLDAVNDSAWERGAITIEAGFDEFNLDIRVIYQGRQIPFPAARPSYDEVLAEGGAQLLAGYLLRHNADRVSSSVKSGTVTILFHFEH